MHQFLTAALLASAASLATAAVPAADHSRPAAALPSATTVVQPSSDATRGEAVQVAMMFGFKKR